jgi:hypothetical protein
MNKHGAHPGSPRTIAICYFCGDWPACLYKDITEKHRDRVCENCVAKGIAVKNTAGIYVMNPELRAETAESPDSDSHSSYLRSGAPDSAA